MGTFWDHFYILLLKNNKITLKTFLFEFCLPRGSFGVPSRGWGGGAGDHFYNLYLYIFKNNIYIFIYLYIVLIFERPKDVVRTPPRKSSEHSNVLFEHHQQTGSCGDGAPAPSAQRGGTL